ncbi:MAG: YdcF family protein [Acetatifactor sp.]
MVKRKRENLVPFEKSERVIHLDQRGKKKKIIPGALLFMILGILCLGYCIAILICGFGTWFFLIWGVMGVFCILAGLVCSKKALVKKIPSRIKRIAGAVCGLMLLLFCAVEGLILSEFGASADSGADYVIVLGAQWKESGPSEVLRRRLDKAIVYLNNSPATRVIVSGGQGENEPVSEAAGMKEYLIRAGIAEERILTEEQSFNTKENLVYSGQLLDRENDTVVLVTNNFHMFRALRIAEKQGYSHVEGLAASSVAGFLPNNLLREFLSVLKNFAVGNL